MAGRSRTPGSRTYGRPVRPRQRLTRVQRQRARLARAWGVASTPLARLDAARAALHGLASTEQADAAEVDRLIDEAALVLWRTAHRAWNAREKEAQVTS